MSPDSSQFVPPPQIFDPNQFGPPPDTGVPPSGFDLSQPPTPDASAYGAWQMPPDGSAQPPVDYGQSNWVDPPGFTPDASAAPFDTPAPDLEPSFFDPPSVGSEPTSLVDTSSPDTSQTAAFFDPPPTSSDSSSGAFDTSFSDADQSASLAGPTSGDTDSTAGGLETADPAAPDTQTFFDPPPAGADSFLSVDDQATDNATAVYADASEAAPSGRDQAGGTDAQDQAANKPGTGDDSGPTTRGDSSGQSSTDQNLQLTPVSETTPSAEAEKGSDTSTVSDDKTIATSDATKQSNDTAAPANASASTTSQQTPQAGDAGQSAQQPTVAGRAAQLAGAPPGFQWLDNADQAYGAWAQGFDTGFPPSIRVVPDPSSPGSWQVVVTPDVKGEGYSDASNKWVIPDHSGTPVVVATIRTKDGSEPTVGAFRDNGRLQIVVAGGATVDVGSTSLSKSVDISALPQPAAPAVNTPPAAAPTTPPNDQTSGQQVPSGQQSSGQGGSITPPGNPYLPTPPPDAQPSDTSKYQAWPGESTGPSAAGTAPESTPGAGTPDAPAQKPPEAPPASSPQQPQSDATRPGNSTDTPTNSGAQSQSSQSPDSGSTPSGDRQLDHLTRQGAPSDAVIAAAQRAQSGNLFAAPPDKPASTPSTAQPPPSGPPASGRAGLYWDLARTAISTTVVDPITRAEAARALDQATKSLEHFFELGWARKGFVSGMTGGVGWEAPRKPSDPTDADGQYAYDEWKRGNDVAALLHLLAILLSRGGAATGRGPEVAYAGGGRGPGAVAVPEPRVGVPTQELKPPADTRRADRDSRASSGENDARPARGSSGRREAEDQPPRRGSSGGDTSGRGTNPDAEEWKWDFEEGWNMSADEQRYQVEVCNGQPGQSFVKNGVRFDGLDPVGNKLIEGKLYRSDEYAVRLLRAPESHDGNRFAFKVLEQAQRQIRAADGQPIEWRVGSKEGQKLVSDLFKANKLDIPVVYRPLPR